MWRRGKDGELERKWETELTESLYDPITAFYNFRAGGFGTLKEGESLEVKGIPYPQPETIVIQMGPQEPGKRQATITIRQRCFDDNIGLVHVTFDDEMIPLTAWTRIPLFGKLSGRLVARY